MDLSIGELSRLTGVPVKTIRYYSDIGLVPASGRTDAGYRRYDDSGLARLELVRTLRELGLDLATIATVAQRRVTLAEVASAHADAVEVHIRQLQLRRTVLRAIARGDTRPEEIRRMSALANACAEEARHIIEEFVDSVFTEHPDDPFADRMRAALPELPEAPSDEQIDAWIELASLVADGDFRARVRHMIAEGSRQRARTGISDADEPTQRAGQAVVERAGAALDQGITPDSPEADPIVTDLVDGFAKAAQRNGDPAYRQELLDQLETFSDARVERYWQLIGVINGWPARDSVSPAYAWFIAALRARSE